jgi:hypothetical protein
VLIVAIFLLPIFLRISVASAGAIGDVLLTCRGNEMAPAICDGDTVRVRVCFNGTLIQAGPKNSTHPGDIIVYCAAAAVPVPQSMWICSRAVDKYRKDGEWCFSTQMDGNSEMDAWEVREHYLLGVVDEVMHGANPQNYESTTNASSWSSGSEDLPGFDILTLAADILTGIMIGIVIGAVVARVYATHKRADSR